MKKINRVVDAQMKNNNTSLYQKILKAIIAIAFIELGVVFAMLLVSKTFTQLDKNQAMVLEKEMMQRHQILEERINTFKNIDRYEQNMDEKLIVMGDEQGRDVFGILFHESSRTALMSQYYEELIPLIKTSGATGAYIVLANEQHQEISEGYFHGMYLKNIAGLSSESPDVYMQVGPQEVAYEKGIARDVSVALKFKIDEASNYFWEPFLKVQKTDSEKLNEHFGTWAFTDSLIKNTKKVLTYTIPLVDPYNNVYGILGVELEEAYLAEWLSTSEMSTRDSFMYLGSALGSNKKKEQEQASIATKPWLLYREKEFREIDEFPQINFEPSTRYEGLFEVGNLNGENYVAMISPISFFSTNSLHDDRAMFIAGIAPTSSLRGLREGLIRSMIMASLISFGLAVLFTFVFVKRLTKPLRQIVQKLKANPISEGYFGRTNIQEMDLLVETLEDANRDLLVSSSKISKIMQVTNLPIGIFEYDKTKKNVFCTYKLIEILEFDPTYFREGYMEREQFDIEMERFNKRIKPKRGGYSFVRKDGRKSYITLKQVNDGERVISIVQDVTQEMQEREKLIYERNYDVLTNILNRRAFMEKANNVIQNQQGIKGALVIWELDNLKFLNDMYGHDMGDKYLCMLADFLRSNHWEKSLVSRLSGDEFVTFVYSETEDYEGLLHQVKTYHELFGRQQFVVTQNISVPASVSAGICLFPQDASNYEDMMSFADFAMYEAKNDAKGSIRVFNEEDYKRDSIMINGVGELNIILKEERVEYAYQPIVSLKTGDILGYEALMRPVSKILNTPAKLLQVAESRVILNLVERITWFKALNDYFMQEYKEEHKLFINSIPSQCLENSEFALLEKLYNTKLHMVVMEIAETQKVNEENRQKKMLWSNKWNIKLALDDYGMGYSNNEKLMSMKLEYIKLDRSGITDIHKLPDQQIFVKDIIKFCHSKKVKVIVEGVEKREELETLIGLGADYVQGYYVAKPDKELKAIAKEKKREIIELGGGEFK